MTQIDIELQLQCSNIAILHRLSVKSMVGRPASQGHIGLIIGISFIKISLFLVARLDVKKWVNWKNEKVKLIYLVCVLIAKMTTVTSNDRCPQVACACSWYQAEWSNVTDIRSLSVKSHLYVGVKSCHCHIAPTPSLISPTFRQCF